MKLHMTLNGLAFILMTIPVFSYGQLKCPPIDQSGQGLQKFDVTAGVGPTLLYGDINHRSNIGYGAFLKADYKLYKGIYVGLEGQVGKLKAKGNQSIDARDWDPRYVDNSYYAGLVNATVYPYRFFINERELLRKGFFERNILYGFHVGIGAGLIFNTYKDVNRQFEGYEDADGNIINIHEGLIYGSHDLVYPVDAAGNPIADASPSPRWHKNVRNTLLPSVFAGLSIPLNKYTTHTGRYFSAVVTTQFNFSNADDLDGYDPVIINDANPQGRRATGAKNDMYNFTAVGLRYTF
ncbi:hypothetical protein [Sphingobacterium wenxiniae]|nr:hypothetical protein [Sphingobacterium wenxiniae]